MKQPETPEIRSWPGVRPEIAAISVLVWKPREGIETVVAMAEVMTEGARTAEARNAVTVAAMAEMTMPASFAQSGGPATVPKLEKP